MAASFFALALLSLGAGSASAAVLNPTADAYVRDGSSASTNFGTATTQEVRTSNSGQNRDSYFKFDVASVSNITNVKLRVRAQLSGSGSVSTSTYGVATTTWAETGITWNNKPALGSVLNSLTISGTSFAWYEFDVTAYVQAEKAAGRNIISLALHATTSSNRLISAKSRESATEKPELLVTANTAPTVSITSPASGATLTQPANVTINATATDSDGNVAKVEFFQGATKLGEDTTAPYTLAWNDVLAASYTLTAVATDNLGTTATSAPVGITVNEGGPTYVSGTISTSTTWTLANSPYIVTGNVNVEGNGWPTLTIQAGVTVKFNSGTELVVNGGYPGALQAVGTAASPILFTANGSTSPGFWQGIYFGNQGATNASQISYATVEYGGFTALGRGGIHVWYSSPTFDRVTVRNNVAAGISINGGSPTITACTVTSNSGPGVKVTAGAPTVSSSTMTSNTGHGIDVTGGAASVSDATITSNTGYAISIAASGSVSGLGGLTASGNGPGKDMIERRAGTIAASQSWPLAAIPYVVTGGVYVEGNGWPTLTIQAGVTVKFNSGTELVVNGGYPGALQALGTAASPILFTANGSTSPGFWQGIYFGNQGAANASQISYATVEYGGFTALGRGGIHVRYSSPTFDHVTVRNNVAAGISVDGGSPLITHTTFSGNPAGLTKTGAVSNVSARFSSWGSASGPSGAGPGTGQSVDAGVPFEPWLVASASQVQFFNSLVQKNRLFNPAISVNTTITAGTALPGSLTISFLDSAGGVLKTYSGSGTSATAIWDGKDAGGADQPDGTYTYELAGTSSGGSVATAARGFSVIDRTKQLALSNLSLTYPYFSPNADGVQDTTTLTGTYTYTFDDTSWTVNVRNPGGEIVRTGAGAPGIALSFAWDGKNASAAVQPDALYTLEAVAVNGSATASASMTTTLDTTVPTVTLSSPTDGQVLSSVYQNGATDVDIYGSAGDLSFDNWLLESGSGVNPSSWTGLASGATPISSVKIKTWATSPLANGVYSLRLQGWDRAGNRGVFQIRPTVGNFTASQNVLQFNAAGGGSVAYSSIVPFTLTETLVLKNAAGQVVRTLTNASRSAGTYSDSWNGRNDSNAIVPDGPYSYLATVTDGNYTYTWDLSTQYLNDYSGFNDNLSIAPYDPFNNQPLTFTYNFPQPGQVSIGLTPNAIGAVPNNCDPPNFCLANNRYEESGPHIVAWAGVDSTGAYRGDIRKVGVVTQRYAFAKNAVIVFGSKPTITNVTVTPPVYGPAVGTQTIAFGLATTQGQTANATITFTNQSSLSILRTITLSNQAPGQRTTTWDGRAENGMWVAPGRYTVTVTATDTLGNQAIGQILTTIQY